LLVRAWSFCPRLRGKVRPHTQRYVERVLEAFNSTHSFVTTDYRFTVNASYMLTLIDMYLRDNTDKQ